MPAPGYILALLLTVSFTLATRLQPVAANWNESRARSGNMLNIIMGDARRVFANHFFVKADVYFHSGYYPSIFDQGRAKEIHIAEQAGPDALHEDHEHNPAHGEPGHVHDEHEEPDGEAPHEHDYLQPPHDWIEAFGRNFFNTEHTELTGAAADEILPWLRISTDLDPQRVDTYTVASFWLRGAMKRPKEAEEFLREGQRANPDSYEILFELGRLYRDNYQDNIRAQRLFQLAERKLEIQEKRTGQPDLQLKRQILISLSRVAEAEGNVTDAINFLQQLDRAFPPEDEAEHHKLHQQIEELRQQLPPAR